MSTHFTLSTLSLLAVIVLPNAHAAMFADFNVPDFRGQPDTQSARWEQFQVAFGEPGNSPVGTATGGVSLSSARVIQYTPGAFITGGGNIYHASDVASYELFDSPANLTDGVGVVLFQLNSLGTLPDFDSVQLVYNIGAGPVSLATGASQIYSMPLGGFGGNDVIHEWRWDIPEPGVQEYSILWDAAGSHMSVSKISLDTQAFSPVPEPAEYGMICMLGLATWAAVRRRKRNAAPQVAVPDRH